MRTEEDLRDALRPLPAEPARTERLHARIVARTRPPARSRRPVILLAAAVAVVLAVVAGIALGTRSREAGPVRNPPSSVERVEGYWNLVARVDPPPGWRVVGHEVTGQVETTDLVDRTDRLCSVDVWGAGTSPNAVRPLEDVTVHGQPAYWDGGRTLQWRDRDDAVAAVTCPTKDDLQLTRRIAERVVVEPTVLRLPLRLRAVPDGYRVVLVSQHDPDRQPGAALVLRSDGSGPEITIDVAPGEPDPAELSLPWRRTTVGGYPALDSARSATLELDVGPHLVALSMSDLQRQDRWAPEDRERLVRLAEGLELAPDLGDLDTWFDAEDAVPS